MSTFKVNDIIKGKVTGIEDYGIFLNLDDGYSGLIHISEISDGFVKNIEQMAEVGEEIYCKIVEVDDENKKMKLSIKNLNYKEKTGDEAYYETVRGFSILKDNLDNWIEEKKEQIKNEE